MEKTFQTIGVIAAMQIEIDGIRAKLSESKTETVSGIEYVRGTLHGKTVIAAKCGVGKVFAAMCAQTMLLRYAPDCIVHTGVAGGLADGLSIFDLVIATHVVQHDMDTSALGDPVGMISGPNIVEIPCDGDIVAALCRSADALSKPYQLGVVATGDQFICTEDARQRIRTRFGAAACEMEGGAVGQVCYVNGTPFGILRSISDGGNDAATVDFPTFAAGAAQTAVAAIDKMVEIL